MNKAPSTKFVFNAQKHAHEHGIGLEGVCFTVDAISDAIATAGGPGGPFEEQLRELMARPARPSEPVATIAIEALDYVESLRRVLACLPSAETLNAAVRDALGREPTTEECAAILAVIDELSRSVVRASTPRIAIEPPSIGNPFEPPPPPPTKAVEGES